MTYPFDGKPPRKRSKRVVPFEKAKKIAVQRDKLADEVDELRRQNEQLVEQRRKAEARGDELETRAAEAEEKLRELQAKLDEQQVESAGGRQRDEERAEREAGAREEEQQVSRLQRRVQSLSSDLERIRRKMEEAEETGRLEERKRLLAGFGTLLDSVERGLSMATEGPERKGLEAIYSQLVDFLRRAGATLIDETGEAMDPYRHEAVDVVSPPEANSREIVEVVRPGIELEDGTVVLPAKVQVAA
jgi:molecular chaperone GrpE